MGIFSLRIDFRGCGNSADNANELEGRTLTQDVEDIQSSADFIRDGKLNGTGIDLTLSSIISTLTWWGCHVFMGPNSRSIRTSR